MRWNAVTVTIIKNPTNHPKQTWKHWYQILVGLGSKWAPKHSLHPCSFFGWRRQGIRTCHSTSSPSKIFMISCEFWAWASFAWVFWSTRFSSWVPAGLWYQPAWGCLCLQNMKRQKRTGHENTSREKNISFHRDTFGNTHFPWKNGSFRSPCCTCLSTSHTSALETELAWICIGTDNNKRKKCTFLESLVFWVTLGSVHVKLADEKKNAETPKANLNLFRIAFSRPELDC